MMYKSFARLMLRDALLHNDGVRYATLAQDRVYDSIDISSRIDASTEPFINIYMIESDLFTKSNDCNEFIGQINTTIHIDFVWVGNAIPIDSDVISVDSFLGIIADVAEQQILDAIFKTTNEKANRFKDFCRLNGSIKIETTQIDGDVPNVIRTIKLPLIVKGQYNSDVYEQDRLNIMTYFSEYADLISCPEILSVLQSIGVINDADKLDIINTDIENGDAPTVTVRNEYE